jgi:hypothetical protein
VCVCVHTHVCVHARVCNAPADVEPEEPTDGPPPPPAIPVDVPALPHAVVVLAGYPAGVDEAEALLTSGPDAPLHCVVEITARYDDASGGSRRGSSSSTASGAGGGGAGGAGGGSTGTDLRRPATVSDVLRGRTVPNPGVVMPRVTVAAWRDVVLVEVDADLPNGTLKPPGVLWGEVLAAVVAAAGDRTRFLSFLAAAKTVALPATGLPPLPTGEGEVRVGATGCVRRGGGGGVGEGRGGVGGGMDGWVHVVVEARAFGCWGGGAGWCGARVACAWHVCVWRVVYAVRPRADCTLLARGRTLFSPSGSRRPQIAPGRGKASRASGDATTTAAAAAAAAGAALVTGLAHYSALLDDLPPAAVGVATVLFALREGAVAMAEGDGAAGSLASTCDDLQV